MSGNKPKLTPAQERAVNSRGGALLVSAAAGSGKTKVLVERLLGYMTNQTEGYDITDFLIITYTRAAANELRTKILDEISARLADEPDNRHLRRQATLCYEAHIGTIHGFCTDIVRENAHLLDMSPDFRLADENECAIMKVSVLEELVESRYDSIEQNPDFSLLVDTMSAGRDDKRLFDIVLDAHSKLLSHADPEGWVNTQLEMLEVNRLCDASDSVWGRYLMADALRKAVYWHDKISELLTEMAVHPELLKAYGDSLAVTVDSIDNFIKALEKGWDEAKNCAAIQFPRPKNVKGYEELKEIRSKCKEAFKKITAPFECSSYDLLSDIATVRPVVRELLSLVIDFNNAFGGHKKKRGIVDFSDLEHMMVRLVADIETGGPSSLGVAISGRFREIMVDEYQDCSGVQELIFNAVSKNGVNLFMVGDVKQSIYRFRLAEPEIFLEKYKSYSDDSKAGEGEGRRILLSTNFRSRAGILDAVNFVFKNIMTEDFGEMNYAENEFLYPGRVDEDLNEPTVELDILDMSTIETDDDEESPEKTSIEAAFVAERIEEILGSGLKIPDGEGGQRPVACGDFAILLRSIKDKAGLYAQALTERHIPSGLADNEDFFQAQEIAVMISLLEIIDNPMQDVPLIAVLTSPIYGFTPDEMARIRQTDKSADFYSALIKASETDEKCRRFLQGLNEFRSDAPDMTSDRLIWHIYNKTDMLGIMGAFKDGESRREKLMKLLDMAAKYEASGYKGLFGFITLIRKLMEAGAMPGEKNDAMPGDAVKLMSIHKSKGLEFPIVFLADTTKRFNNRDAAKPLLLHAKLGVGPKVTDFEKRIEYTTLSRMAVSNKLTREMTAEELRVLYVAMTRAREKLIIVATFADASKELSKLSKDAAVPIPPQVLEGVTSLSGYILLPALTRPEALCLRGDDFVPSCESGTPWDIRKICIEGKAKACHTKETTSIVPAVVHQEDVTALRERLEFVYPYAKAPLIPSKLTATELKGRFADYEVAEEAAIRSFNEANKTPLLRPRFLTSTGQLTAAEKGTALHLAMQYIDYDKCVLPATVKEELTRLREMNFLNEKQAGAVDPVKISTFFNSEIGKRMMAADQLYREFKFSLLVKASDYYDMDADTVLDDNKDEILFQGVIDCCFEEKGVLHIIDFKTDYVTEETLEEKKRLYAAQVTGYGHAMERITGLPVKSKILYFFAIGRAEEI